MREPVATGRNGPSGLGGSAVRYRRTFLALRSWAADRAECELIGPDTNMFHDLGRAPVRYLARPARGSGTVQVQVVRKETRQPQEGCEVFAAGRQYSTEPGASRGVTDQTGAVRLAPESGLKFVAVRYEDLILKAPLLPGASPDPLVFELPTRGRRSDYVRPLRQLYRELTDQVLVDNQLIKELEAKARAKDAGEVRRLVAEGTRQRLAVEEVLQRVREIETRARADGEDVSALATEVREFAQRESSRSLDNLLADSTAWADRLEKSNTIREMNEQIKELSNKMDWAGLVPLYERLVAADPDNRENAAQLRRLENDLRIKSPDHSRARAFADRQLSSITARDLADRWPEIDAAAQTLLAAGDHLTLRKLRRQLSQWSRDLNNEVKGLIDQVKAAGDDEQRVQELRDNLGRLNQQHQSLQTLYREIHEFLEKLDAQ
jgi:hypothetical protein